MKKTTKGLYLGAVEAEQEAKDIGSFFEDFTNIGEAIDRGKFIICGRKGSGKSAYAVWHQRRANDRDQSYVAVIRKDDFSLESMVNDPNTQVKNNTILFEWMILVRLVKMIIDSKIGSELREIKAINRFYTQNSGWTRIDQYSVEEIVKGREINFSALKNELGEFKSIKSQKATTAPFIKLIDPLREAVFRILKWQIFENASFKVIFDDLDVKFKLTSEPDIRMLLDLIRISKRYNTEYLVDTKAQIILLVRDDIMENLSGTDCDVAKTLSSSTHNIKWYEHDTYGDGRNSMLKKLINRRLSLAFDKLQIKIKTPNDPWASFVVSDILGKASFKYILDYTFYLPRDIVAIFQNIGDKNYVLPLSEDNINELLEDFARMKYYEIVDELTVLYSKNQIAAIFDALSQINDGFDVSYDEVITILSSNGFGHDDLRRCIDYNLLIPVDPVRGHLYFKYRERVPYGGLQKYTYRTPYILTTYFRIR